MEHLDGGRVLRKRPLRGVPGARGGPAGDLGRAYLQGGSQEFGGGGEERGSGTVWEEIFFGIPSGIPSPKVSDFKFRKNSKNHADSFGQIPKS